MPIFEICPECYEKYFLSYSDMEIVVSKDKYICYGCGKMKHVVRKVLVNNKIIDMN